MAEIAPQYYQCLPLLSIIPMPLTTSKLNISLQGSKNSGHLLLRDSRDSIIASSPPTLKAGKWHAENSVWDAEDRLKFERILGHTQTGRAGFGLITRKKIPPKQSYEYRRLVTDTIKDFEEEVSMAKAVQLQVQGHWTKWCSYVKNDLSWKTLLAMSQSLLKFSLGATFDTLPSPSNLKRWRIAPIAACCLCHKSICTSAHILSGCSQALIQGRYTYRHDAVLKTLVELVKVLIQEIKPSSIINTNKIKFVKAGARVPSKNKRESTPGLLHQCLDWNILVDLDEKLCFPAHITLTALRPDLVFFSNSIKYVILIELTCPCEENFEHDHHHKLEKYLSLCSAVRSNGWSVS